MLPRIRILAGAIGAHLSWSGLTPDFVPKARQLEMQAVTVSIDAAVSNTVTMGVQSRWPTAATAPATCRCAVQTHTMILGGISAALRGDCAGSRNSILVQCGGRDRVAGGGGLAPGQRSGRIGGRSLPASHLPVSRACVRALPGVHDPARDGTGAGAQGGAGQSQCARPRCARVAIRAQVWAA